MDGTHVPSPRQQRRMVQTLEEGGSRYLYPVCRVWYEHWRRYVRMEGNVEEEEVEDSDSEDNAVVDDHNETGKVNEPDVVDPGPQNVDSKLFGPQNVDNKLLGPKNADNKVFGPHNVNNTLLMPQNEDTKLSELSSERSNDEDLQKVDSKKITIRPEHSELQPLHEHNNMDGRPGPLTMDTSSADHNLYVGEGVWRQWLHWYGVDRAHPLERRLVPHSAAHCRRFEVCVLSTYSGQIQHPWRNFDIREELGWIEVLVRRMYGVLPYCRSRMWFRSGGSGSGGERFQLVGGDKHQALREVIQELKEPDCEVIILALEVCSHDNSWPTHLQDEQPTVADGLSSYDALTQGGNNSSETGTETWKHDVSVTLESVLANLGSQLNTTLQVVVSNQRASLVHEQRNLTTARVNLDQQRRQAATAARQAREKLHAVQRQEEVVRAEARRLQRDHDALNAERSQLRREMLQMEQVNRIAEARVRLDVGGHLFTTSTVTLTRDGGSRLASMFAGRHALTRQTDGTYFIDRDGTHFRYVLNYLRDGGFRPGALPRQREIVEEILAEAEYYQINGLVKLLMELVGGAGVGEGAAAEGDHGRTGRDQEFTRQLSNLYDNEEHVDQLTPERLVSSQ